MELCGLYQIVIVYFSFAYPVNPSEPHCQPNLVIVIYGKFTGWNGARGRLLSILNTGLKEEKHLDILANIQRAYCKGWRTKYGTRTQGINLPWLDRNFLKSAVNKIMVELPSFTNGSRPDN